MDWIEVIVVCWAILLIVFIVCDMRGIHIKARYWLWGCVAAIMLGSWMELESFLDPVCKSRGGVQLRSAVTPYQCYDRTTLKVLAPVSAVRVPTYPR